MIIKIEGITDDYLQEIEQSLNIIGLPNDSITLSLKYNMQDYYWYFDFFYYKSGVLYDSMYNIRLTQNRVLLYNQRSIYPFNMACLAKNEYLDPVYENAFVNGVASDSDYGIFLYTADELTNILTA